MAYTAYEAVAGEAMSQTEAMTRSYTDATSRAFETTTEPSLIVVEQHLTSVHAEMVGMMVSAGYAVAQTDTTVLDFLVQYNARGAAYYIELGKATSGFASEDGQGRLAEFARWRTQLADFLETDALALMGAAKISSTSGESRLATAGGLTLSERSDRSDDTDFNPMAFGHEHDFSNTSVLDTEAS